MATANQRNMAKKMYEVFKANGSGPRAASFIARAFKEGKFKMEDFSIRALAVEACGQEWVNSLTHESSSTLVLIQEGVGGAVDSTGFSNLLATVISGLIDEEPEEADVGLAESLISFKTVQREAGDKRIKLLRVGREASRVVKEGEDYSAYSFGENWENTPDTEKRGGMVLLTKEMIAEDRTGEAIEMARTVVQEARMNRAERILLHVLGVNNSGTYLPQDSSEAHFVSSGAGLINPARINLTASAELLDWTDLDEALLRWVDMTDIVTGRPISILPSKMTLLHMPGKRALVNQILTAQTIEQGTVTTTAGAKTFTNPALGVVERSVHSALCQHLLTRSASDVYQPGGGLSASDATKLWFMGDPKRAFEYRTQWPFTIETLDRNSLLAFTRDVVFGVKVSEKGVMSVKDPRYWQKMTG